MEIRFGISTGFAINRYVEPEDWTRIVAEDLGLNLVQFTADLLNPWYPEDIVNREAEKIRNNCEKYKIRIETTFTSQFTRVNHLLHPDKEIRLLWFDWFKRFFRLSAYLGAEGSGSHFGIMTHRDWNNVNIRDQRLREGVELWRKLAEFGAEVGLQYLIWEPMSVPREIGETIESTEKIQNLCKDGFSIPLLLCYDVDHGDITSPNPCDTDPHFWIHHFGNQIRVIHLKQSLQDKGGHYPFTEEYNRKGKIHPTQILDAIQQSNIETCSLILEISHRERNPYDQQVIQDLKQSVEYWRPHLDKFNK